MKSKIILMLVISSLIIGCVDTTKIPGMTKSQPCIQTTSQNGGFIGTISQGDCSELQKRGFSSDEQKLIGTWKFTGATGNYMKFTFKPIFVRFKPISISVEHPMFKILFVIT